MNRAVYDQIGLDYAKRRRPDPRIAAWIEEGLGDAHSVVNVGAGTGSYEPADRRVIAVEPSPTMLAQRPLGSAAVVQAVAEALPFADKTFDASLAVLTLHHWKEPQVGLAELRRVARRRAVVLTWDQDVWEACWLLDYFPTIAQLDRNRWMPLTKVIEGFGGGVARIVPVPHDCRDGFDGAFSGRPEAYLDPTIRAGMSNFALADPTAIQNGVQLLAGDLRDGT